MAAGNVLLSHPIKRLIDFTIRFNSRYSKSGVGIYVRLDVDMFINKCMLYDALICGTQSTQKDVRTNTDTNNQL